jgi:hypothetical protein
MTSEERMNHGAFFVQKGDDKSVFVVSREGLKLGTIASKFFK